MTKETIDECKLAYYSPMSWTSHARKAAARVAEMKQAAPHLLSRDNVAYLNWIRKHNPEGVWDAYERFTLGRSMDEIPNSLYYASFLGLEEVVRLLLHKGADVTARGDTTTMGFRWLQGMVTRQ
jgi:hypothetical protein